jgi:hypothetical protein
MRGLKASEANAALYAKVFFADDAERLSATSISVLYAAPGRPAAQSQ